MKLLLLSPILILLSISQVHAQFAGDSLNTSDRFLIWIAGGLGVSSPGVGVVLKATTVLGEHSLSARMESAFRYSWGGGSSGAAYQGYGVFYGRQQVRKTSIGRIAAGPVYFKKNADRHFGLGVEAEVIYTANPFGLGLMGAVSASPDAMYAVLTINLSIGKLWSQ